jgi:putative ABC transport system substrate-binding protein
VRETRSIPIVFVGVSNPLGSGFVASIARPGSNASARAAARAPRTATRMPRR